MALKNSLLLYLVFIATAIRTVEGKIILPELLTKQAVNNIRLLTQDGKFTYYQKRSGSLLFSTNYKVQEMLKGEIGTEYNLISSPARKKIVIVQNQNFHNFYSLRAKLNIFLVDFGESTPREVGSGVSPTLLLDDAWLSYYDPYSKVLNFENTNNLALKFSIKLNNRINPYFVPKVIMADDNTVYYTDLSETGIVGLLEYKRNTSKSEIIFKASAPLIKADICLSGNHLVLGLFGIHFSKQGSSISRAPLPMQDFSKRETLYSSELNDLGHLICDFDKDNIAFIKNYGSTTIPGYDVASLKPSDKTLTPLSELKTISNIINMDGTLLTQEKGKFYILKGNVDYKSSDILNTKSEVAPEKELENE